MTRPKAKRRPTLKQKRFAKAYAAHGNATRAAREAGYAGTEHTLQVVGSENLSKPVIQELVEFYGKDLKELADEVVKKRLMDDARPDLQMRAADMVYKLRGEYAAEKHEHVVNPHPLLPAAEEERLRKIEARVLEDEQGDDADPGAPEAPVVERSDGEGDSEAAEGEGAA